MKENLTIIASTIRVGYTVGTPSIDLLFIGLLLVFLVGWEIRFAINIFMNISSIYNVFRNINEIMRNMKS